MVCMPSVFPVACHTDQVGPGSTFVAIQGLKADGIIHIPTALKKGATTIVIAAGVVLGGDIELSIHQAGATLVRVENTRRALAELSAQAAGYPATQLKLIAITGTKGKTTSSFLLTHLLESAGHRVAVLSTVNNRIAGVVLPTLLTTQQPDYLHQFFKLCVEQQITHVVMEVAAQAVSLFRVHGLQFDALLFTNFSEEHGEFYATMPEYFAAKVALLAQRAPGAPALINGDDAWCAPLVDQHAHCSCMSMSDVEADVQGVFAHKGRGGVQGVVRCYGREYPVACPALVGGFNAYNIMGVVGLAHFLGLEPEVVAQGLHIFMGVPGRLAQYALPNGACCYIDYAHNPSSYQAVLSTLRELTDHLVVIFGAGGERDKAKRPVMGAIAADYADLVVVTSDNPRTEQVEQIVEDICAGIPADKQTKVMRELDREMAIRKAYSVSRLGTILVLLGKGTDEYQMIGTTKTPFSEAEIIRSL